MSKEEGMRGTSRGRTTGRPAYQDSFLDSQLPVRAPSAPGALRPPLSVLCVNESLGPVSRLG